MFGFMFGSFFTIIWSIMFVGILSFIVFSISKSLIEYSNNNNSPIFNEIATVIAKRTDFTHNHSNNQHHHTSSVYYVTFEFDKNRERLELKLKGKDYALLVEGDMGTLEYQGTRFLNFHRQY